MHIKLTCTDVAINNNKKECKEKKKNKSTIKSLCKYTQCISQQVIVDGALPEKATNPEV